MPTLSSGDKALVTGSNGYLAMWIIRGLMERGYSVRGAVRSAEKGKHLEDYFASYGSKFELVIVPDITKEGAFDEAVKGIHAVVHRASPVQTTADDPQELISPALHGTSGIIKSVLKNGGEVKRRSLALVQVSESTTKTIGTKIPSGKLKERGETPPEWRNIKRRRLSQKRVCLSIPLPGTKLKTTSVAAWKLYNEHKSKVNWDLTVILPPYIFGPVIHEVASPNTLNISMKFWWDMIVSQETKTREALGAGGSWVHVCDLADAHVLALEKEAAGGERIIASAGQWVWQEWADTARVLQPSPLPDHEVSPGFPDIQKGYPNEFDTRKASAILGIKWRSKEETTRDILEDFAKHGW